MAQREVRVKQKVIETLASISYHIESKGMYDTANKFFVEAIDFFQTLSSDFIERRDCPYKRWKGKNYKCISYKKKYVIAFLSLENEVVICDFVPYKLLKE